MAQAGLRARVRYAFDNTMSRGTSALIGWLGLASAVLVVLFATVTIVVAPGDAAANGHWAGMLWRSLMRIMDPGAISGDTGSPLYLATMLAVTIGGVFIFSALIGVLTTGLETRIADLRRGRSRIIEQHHTVLLGWSEQVFTVVSELVTANQSERRSCVAILADRDKVDMEQELRDRIGGTGRTRVVCRRGNPLAPADLELVSPDTARSIMVVAPPIDDPDTHVIKVLLSLGARTWAKKRPPVVASVADPDNLPAARLAGGPDADVIDADDLAARLVVQSHRQAGLSTVCADLLGFDGDEFYMRREPSLTGRTYGAALTAYELEINDDANREVAQVTKADDFIVSKKLISLLLTQLTENQHLRDVYAELLSPEGSELYMKPAADYVEPGAAANFATVIESARRRGHTAIGYRRHEAHHRPPNYGIALNPDKTAPLTLTAADQVVVLAEN